MNREEFNLTEMQDFVDTIRNADDVNNDIKLIFTLLPYFILVSEDDEQIEEEINIYTMHTINSFISPFSFEIDGTTFQTVGEKIIETLNEKTFGAIMLTEDDIDDYTKFVINIENQEQITVLTLIYMGKSTAENFNENISLFIKNFKTHIILDGDLDKYLQNLVYIPLQRFIELSYGETYSIDVKGEISVFDISNGVLLNKDISDLYEPKEGDEPITSGPTPKHNFPFKSQIYNSIQLFYAGQFIEFDSTRLFETYDDMTD